MTVGTLVVKERVVVVVRMDVVMDERVGRVGVTIGVGVGTLGIPLTYSYAPISQPAPWGRATLFISLEKYEERFAPALIAGLSPLR